MLLLGAGGFGAGVLARVGIGIDDAFGDRTIRIFDDTPGGVLSTRVAAGQVWIDVGAIPDGPVTVDARIGFGNINIGIYAGSDVAVEVRTEIDRGDAQLNGRTQHDDIMRLGPTRGPDVIVLAHVGVGQVHLDSYPGTISLPQGETPLLGDGPFDPLVGEPSQWTQVTDGLAVSTDGWIVLDSGEALIDPDNVVVSGDVDSRSGLVFTNMGPFVVVDGTITTPDGAMFSLEDLRQEYSTALPPDVVAREASELTPPPTTLAIEQTNTSIGG